MFRMSLLSCVVLAVVAQGIFAQDKLAKPIPNFTALPDTEASEIPSFQSEPARTVPSGTEPQSDSEAKTVKKDEWAPAMRVFLNETPGVQAVVQDKTLYIDQFKTVFETVMKNGKEIQTPRQVTIKVPRINRSVTTGATVIDCDDVNVQVSTSEDGAKAFDFEIRGKLHLRNGSTLIEAKSAKLVDGKLTLTEVTLKTDSMKMTCTAIVLDLQVNALRVGEVTEPTLTPTPLTPIPSPGFAPSSPSFPSASYNDPFSSPPLPLSPPKSKRPTQGVFRSP